MQIPSVFSLYSARLGAVRSRIPARMAGFAGEYAAALEETQAKGEETFGELTAVPDASAQALQAPQETQAAEVSASAQAASQTGKPRIFYTAPAASSSKVLPLYIPKAQANIYSPQGYGELGLGRQIAAYAQQFVGLPYVPGGESLTEGADCSGFTQSVFKHFGISLPRSSYSQSKVGTQVDPENLQPGDLLFFKTADYAPVTHVVIYIGDGKVVQAANSKQGTIISSLGKDWQTKKHFVVARRVTGQ
jgi:cell wall-associated NlpC family hydrolase